ncbi:MAG TPA: UvrD-helicase domain-containing protein [Candidatus Deferrimicrobiaceae bacterium]
MQPRLFPASSDGAAEILSGLDPDQRRAVTHPSGPILLVAGAGSGKTRAIVARIARLLHEGVPPRSIVGITFTNRAAEEMRERVAKLFPGRKELPWLGTFHAYGALLLRRYGSRIGLSPGFLIYDARDQGDVLKGILKEQNIDEKKFPARKFADLIERAKRGGKSIEDAALEAGWLFVGKAEDVAKAYDAALTAAGAIDFTDLIRLPVRLFREAPEVLETVRRDTRHLLVDEFQDVDGLQATLTKMLATGADSFCAVGDEDQSIYGWRGGSAGPMLSFERDYPGATIVHLATNYRTVSSILSAAGAVIAKNSSRRDKRIVAAREGGDPPVVRIYNDSDTEAREVAMAISTEIHRGTAPSDIAVFYRINSQSRAFEDALRQRDVKYVLRGALSFYDRAVVRDAVAWLKWVLHPDDLVSLRRLLKSPRRGVGEAKLSAAAEGARREGVPVSAMLAGVPQLTSLFQLRMSWLGALPERTTGEALRSLLDEGGYLSWLRDAGGSATSKEREDDLANIGELLRMAEAFEGTGEEGVTAFLETVSLSPRDMNAEEGEAVRLMTLHNAKGLEFPVIFLVGVEEGLLPHSRSADSEDDIEEERRLFYVGLTRARERATLSFVRRRNLFGSWKDAIPSRFLSEIPPAMLRWEDETSNEAENERVRFSSGRPYPTGARVETMSSYISTRSYPPTPATRAGRPATVVRRPVERESSPFGEKRAPDANWPKRVLHPVFGEGRVESSEGEGPDQKLIVRFQVYGLKKLLVRAAKMELFY